jgi:hypothetical protein
MRRLLLVALVVGVPLAAQADPKADAIALFDQGIKDLEAGNFEPACKELAASLALYDDSGTKGALAECQTSLGKVASAWKLWRDLAVTAPAADLRADAEAKAVALEAQLPRYVLRLDGPALSGLVITVNDTVVDPSLSVPLPIDPPTMVVTARAPDHEPWTQTFAVSQGTTTSVEIPPLREVPEDRRAKLDPLALDPSASAVRDLMLLREVESTRRTRHIASASISLAGVAMLGVGTYFGLSARAKWNDVESTCRGSLSACPEPAFAEATSEVSSARSRALVSTILFVAGGATVVGGGYLWFTAPSVERSRTGLAVHVTPTVDVRSIGVSVTGDL